MAPRLTEGSALTRQLKSLLARVERDLAHKREAARRLAEEIGQHERLMRNLRVQDGKLSAADARDAVKELDQSLQAITKVRALLQSRFGGAL